MKLDTPTKSENTKVLNEIISSIGELINMKNLEPGDKLPSERMLSEKFGVSRGIVRDAIQKLELYGLLASKPQSGTFVANIGVTAMNGMIEDILRLEEQDFKGLVETRILLELKTARLASMRRTKADLDNMKSALTAYAEKVTRGENAVEEDLLFHLAVAKACGNATINTFMLMITPEIITNFEKHHVCGKSRALLGIEEHQAIYDAIEQQNPQLAKQKMKDHFSELYHYCYNI